jgi:Arc/MetJ family transcription regulator
MPVTSVDIDAQLLQEAKDALGVRTTKDAVDVALRDAVARRRQLAAIDVIAGLDLDPNPRRIAYQ